MSKVILMKVTSRERPYKLIQCVKNHLDLANNLADMVWVFSFDTDDFNINKGHYLTISELVPGCKFSIKDRTNKIGAINDGVPESGWDILLNISDDQHPIVKGYDDFIRTNMPDDLDRSLWFSDGWQNRINTQEIIGFNYYKRFNHIYHPEFKSFFCDNLSTEIAIKLGKSIKINKCIIKHLHPGFDASLRGKADGLYKHNDSHWKHDEDLYNKLKQTGLDKLCQSYQS